MSRRTDSTPAPASSTLRRLLGLLAGLALVWIPLQFLVWPRVQPAYSAAVASGAGAALRLVEAGEPVTTLRADGRVVHLYSALREDAQPVVSYDTDLLHFYAVLLISLMLVYPGRRPARRIGETLLAAVLLYAFHVAVLLINAEYLYAVALEDFSRRHYTGAERALHSWLRDSGSFLAVQLVPAAALAALFLRHGIAGGPSRWRAGSRSSSRRPAAIALVAMALAGLGLYMAHLPRVRARQAEKQCASAYRALEAGDRDGALRLFESALARLPDFDKAAEGLGIVYTRAGRLDEAVGLYQGILSRSPRHVQAHLHLGNAWFAAGRLDEAVAQYERVLDIEPSHREGGLNLAAALVQSGRREEAESVLEDVVESYPDFTEAIFQLAASRIAGQRACAALPLLVRLESLGVAEPARRELVAETIRDLRPVCPEVTPPRP